MSKAGILFDYIPLSTGRYFVYINAAINKIYDVMIYFINISSFNIKICKEISLCIQSN